MKTCSRCGHQNKQDAIICENCLVNLHWAKVNLGKFTGTIADTKRIGEMERNLRNLPEKSNAPATKTPPSGPNPLRIGFGYGLITFVVSVLGVTLFQFFLQFGLAGRWNTSDFWSSGFAIGCTIGSVVGIPLAVVVASFAGIVTHLKNKYPEKEISD